MRRFSMRHRVSAIAVAGAVSLGVAGAPASAAQQDGLVNVDLTNNTVQVPVGVAANICGVQAGVIASGLFQANDACTAVSTTGRPAGRPVVVRAATGAGP